MRTFSFAASSLLAGAGVAVAVFGVIAEESKPLWAGLIMLLGAVVFAMLYRGGQLASRQMAYGDAADEREL